MELISIYSLTNHSQKNWEFSEGEKSTANREKSDFY
jgi:hypothetical protein